MCENGSELPKKFGWVTLVIASVFDRPLSLAGLSCPVSGDRDVGHVRRVGRR